MCWRGVRAVWAVNAEAARIETNVLNRLFPQRIDNDYRGYKMGLWLFVPITCMRLGISLLHIFSVDGGAQSISTMPLDTYPPGAAQNVIALFARMGVDQLALSLVFGLALIRYRAMIPLMYALMVLHEIALRGVVAMKPLALAGTSGARTPGLVLAALTTAGLALSLLGKGYER